MERVAAWPEMDDDSIGEGSDVMNEFDDLDGEVSRGTVRNGVRCAAGCESDVAPTLIVDLAASRF